MPRSGGMPYIPSTHMVSSMAFFLIYSDFEILTLTDKSL